MADPTPAPKLAPDPADSPESQSQLVVALAIVAAMTVLGIGLIIAAVVSKQWAILPNGVFMILGAFATALNAPTGVGKLLNAAKQQPQKPLDPQS